MTAIAFGPPVGLGSTLGDSGVSELAGRIAEGTRLRVASYLRTAHGQGLFAGPASDLAASVGEARELAAVGEASVPGAAALKEAHEFLDSLPESLPRPTIGIEPSGAIGFEWDVDRDRFAILALKGTGVLEFSVGSGPGERQWGVRNFAGCIDARTLRDLLEIGVRN